MCYPNTFSTAPHKLAPRSTRCVFLGYSPDHKGYRCFDLTSRRVLISRHVVFDESDFPYSTSSTPSPDPELESQFPTDPVVQPPLPVCPFPAGFPGTQAPLSVIPAAPSAAPVPAVAPPAAPRPPVVLRADPVSLAAPRATPVPSPAPVRYAQPVQVYQRRSAPPRYAQPMQVYQRRSPPTPTPPPAPEALAMPTPEPSPPSPPPAPSQAEPVVYHPPVIHRNPRHIHSMVTRRMASQAATLFAI